MGPKARIKIMQIVHSSKLSTRLPNPLERLFTRIHDCISPRFGFPDGGRAQHDRVSPAWICQLEPE